MFILFFSYKFFTEFTLGADPSKPSSSRFRFNFLQVFKYVLILLRALPTNSGNCSVHKSIISSIFSSGWFEMGT